MDNFTRFLCVMHVLANCPTGATAGMVAKKVSAYGCHLTKVQAELTLKQMGQGGYVHTEKRDYRTNIRSTYYHLNESAVMALNDITQTYNENEKQRVLAI